MDGRGDGWVGIAGLRFRQGRVAGAVNTRPARFHFAALWREDFARVIGVTVPPASLDSAAAITLSRSPAACW